MATLAGFHEALNRCTKAISGVPQKHCAKEMAGRITLMDKRTGYIYVVVDLDAVQETPPTAKQPEAVAVPRRRRRGRK